MKRNLSTVRSLNRLLAVVMATATLSVAFVAPVFAEYKPRDGGSAPRSSTTTVVRGDGCSAASTTGLVPLAPQTHVGLAASTQPTFAWYTPEKESYLTEFRIAEYLPNGQFQVIYKTEFDSTDKTGASGITTLSLRETEIRLSPGTTYRWQAVLVCNPNRPSESLVAEADIAVVEDSLPDTTSAMDAGERATLYAEAGLWYDAMGEALSADAENGRDIKISLLEDLAAIEAQANDAESNPTVNVSYSDYLREVIAAIQ